MQIIEIISSYISRQKIYKARCLRTTWVCYKLTGKFIYREVGRDKSRRWSSVFEITDYMPWNHTRQPFCVWSFKEWIIWLGG